jgi:hypothetical protein
MDSIYPFYKGNEKRHEISICGESMRLNAGEWAAEYETRGKRRELYAWMYVVNRHGNVYDYIYFYNASARLISAKVTLDRNIWRPYEPGDREYQQCVLGIFEGTE